MREIKFRAWNDETKRMCFNVAVKNGYQVTPVQTSGNDSWDAIYEESENIVMQYTGLKDKNGKEIYEGDICKAIDSRGKEWVCPIEFIEGGFMFKSNYNTFLNSSYAASLEIIGNIYENPELIAK